jgi:hypothetical protein
VVDLERVFVVQRLAGLPWHDLPIPSASKRRPSPDDLEGRAALVVDCLFGGYWLGDSPNYCDGPPALETLTDAEWLALHWG